MLKRTISIGLLMSMSFVLAAPMLHIECDMPCCQVEKMTCCEAKQEKSLEKTCRIDMKSCDMGGVFIPIIAGPFHHDNLNVYVSHPYVQADALLFQSDFYFAYHDDGYLL